MQEETKHKKFCPDIITEGIHHLFIMTGVASEIRMFPV